MGRYCGHCGNWMDPSAKKCPNCGKGRKTEFLRRIIAAILVLLAVILIGSRFVSLKINTLMPTAQMKQLSKVRKYDNQGKLCAQFDFIYDQDQLALVRMICIDEDGQVSTGSEISIEYDEEGRLTRYGTIGEGRYEKYEFDSNGALIRCIQAEGGAVETFYEYDVMGRLEETLSVSDAGEQVCHYVYDNDNRCLRKNVYSYYEADLYGEGKSCDLQVYMYRYDPQGNLIEIDGGTDRTVYTYDEQGRKTKEVIEYQYGYTYTTNYNYEYNLFTLSNSSYENNGIGYHESFYTAELRYADACPVWTFNISPDSITAGDEDGYLTRITAVDGSTEMEFFYA